MTTQMTEKQSQAMEAPESARRDGVTLRVYAQAQGLAVQDLYNAIACLRRKGLLPKPPRNPRSKFVALRIESGSRLCRSSASVAAYCAGSCTRGAT